MKYCPNCGAEAADNAIVCVKCGCGIQQINNAASQEADNSVRVGFVILSIIFPMFGIIYWAIKAKECPRCARTCGIAAIISWIVSILISFFIIYFVCYTYYKFLINL